MEIYQQILQEATQNNATLVLVTKTKPTETIMKYYDLGHRDFGENRVQELVYKYEQLPKDIRWHMIGHLQKNKVKYITPFIHLIHSVDDYALLAEIEKRAAQNKRIIDVLLEIKIAEEESKYGMDKTEYLDLLEEYTDSNFENVRICGLMGMGTFTYDEEQTRLEFSYLKDLFDEMICESFADIEHFNIISMGMSGDYRIALECGSNMLRIGSLIVG